MPATFPLFLPTGVRGLFESESLLRRLARLAHWDARARILELFGSLSGLSLAKLSDCALTVVDASADHLEDLRERAQLVGIAGRLATQVGNVLELQQPPASFSGVLSLGRVTGSVASEAKRLRPLLAPGGRLGLTTVVRVGRQSSEQALRFWEARLGAPLLLPRAALMELEREGFEPELIETVSDAELDDFYHDVEVGLSHLNASGPGLDELRGELSLYQALRARSGYSYGFVVGRKKEPGEKPPPSRDSG